MHTIVVDDGSNGPRKGRGRPLTPERHRSPAQRPSTHDGEILPGRTDEIMDMVLAATDTHTPHDSPPGPPRPASERGSPFGSELNAERDAADAAASRAAAAAAAEASGQGGELEGVLPRIPSIASQRRWQAARRPHPLNQVGTGMLGRGGTRSLSPGPRRREDTGAPGQALTTSRSGNVYGNIQHAIDIMQPMVHEDDLSTSGEDDDHLW